MKRLLETLLFAFAGWAACGATMGIGLSLVPLDNLLILHAVAAPIYFGVLSLIYFRRWRHAGPLTTALIFVGFVFLLDFFVVALIIYHSLDMFKGLLGTWVPFLLIFGTTWATGELMAKRNS